VSVTLVGAGKARVALHAEQTKIKTRSRKAEEAAARGLGAAMVIEAPKGKGGKRGRRLAETIEVRHTALGTTVGPQSPLTHLVVKGAARGQTVMPVAKQSLAWPDSGGTVFAHSSQPGPMPANDFVTRAREIAGHEARVIAGEVLFRDVPLPPDPKP